MEDYPVKIRKWLYPLSWIYGLGVDLRNWLFHIGVLKSKSYPVPVICVGNITAGGTGKTPHIEYLVELLKDRYSIAVLSRGYKRKTKGFVLADDRVSAADIGDEPFQIKNKYPDVTVAVDENRCEGIERLLAMGHNRPDVILLDDAYQHLYVKAGLNILLVNNNRIITEDALLPAGLLREPVAGRLRAHVVVLTKCPADMSPIDYRIRSRQMNLFPYQQLFFSTFRYKDMYCLSDKDKKMSIYGIKAGDSVLLLSGVADNSQLAKVFGKTKANVKTLFYPDHHGYAREDLSRIEKEFNQLPSGNRYVVTTEKDTSKLVMFKDWVSRFGGNVYVLPVQVEFLLNNKEKFDKYILDYVGENKRNG
ncbi:MAG TPA: tetraacyldisaccharide 4'-kinase [Candidatus Avibacteroides excrementipullorum]|jgi:tetraacyldisaccharide 4'-kinase|nr:tetraacyldisaccharide 4'-kinase [Candidatus Avibacteroides excrementipullorum]